MQQDVEQSGAELMYAPATAVLINPLYTTWCSSVRLSSNLTKSRVFLISTQGCTANQGQDKINGAPELAALQTPASSMVK